jgi:GNAT superfamily N-acetyltransferase
MSRPTIIVPQGAEEMAAFRQLNWDYLGFLLTTPSPNPEFVRSVYSDAKYEALLAAAETDNRPPRGQMRLAMDGDTPLGCGTVQTIGSGDAEIKRVYVAPAARGTGLGRALMERLIDDCRALNMQRILMDTGRVLTDAQALYDRLGFHRRGPYQDLPAGAEDLLVFYEMSLERP